MTHSDEHPEWKPLPGARYYEASHRGHVRSVDRVIGGRRLRSVVLKATLNNDGYPMIGLTDDDGCRIKKTVHSCVLLAHVGPPGEGEETLHGPGGKQDNRWPENIRYGTKEENHADQVAAGTAVVPESFECVNHARCGGKVRNPGRRCLTCIAEIRRDAAALLSLGMNAVPLAARYGYKDTRWLIKLAQEGGWEGTAEQARTQHPTLTQRARLAFRRRGDGT